MSLSWRIRSFDSEKHLIKTEISVYADYVHTQGCVALKKPMSNFCLQKLFYLTVRNCVEHTSNCQVYYDQSYCYIGIKLQLFINILFSVKKALFTFLLKMTHVLVIFYYPLTNGICNDFL